DGKLFGIHIEGTRSPDGRLYRGHTGAARLAFETGSPIIPVAIIGTDKIQKQGQVWPDEGKTTVIYGAPIEVEKVSSDKVTHEMLRELTDRVVNAIQAMSGQEYVDEYAQSYKQRLKEQEQKAENQE
ncbi:MAG: lysophospholipid acyltransferase family protein, partial [Bifidobacteriaceae bacterium]|nr:lysophospholipid acyltransferase family protein [Bifidobacteriaceae bacterium]